MIMIGDKNASRRWCVTDECDPDQGEYGQE